MKLPFDLNKLPDEEKQQITFRPQSKKYGWKFWVAFWLVSAIFLTGWTIFWQVKNGHFAGLIGVVRPLVKIAPIKKQQKKEVAAILEITEEISKDPQEKTFLVLFQNNWELRPGGGFIGAFGIVKIKGQKVSFADVHDTNVFDSRVATGITPPYPMGKMLGIKHWELRDSNWSPDFPTNARKAEELYHLEGGQEQLDGVIAISTEVLNTFLEISGPISLPDYPGEYNSQNAIEKLEYQVEQGYREQGIEKGKRKYIMKDLTKAIIGKISSLSWKERQRLLLALEKHLNQKDIVVFFHKTEWEQKMEALNWAGEVKKTNGDYLMMVDANLGALKTDRQMKRSFQYQVDFSQERPRAILKIIYQNTAQAKDWLTADYNAYLRVYVPRGSWLTEAKNVGEKTFGEELDKKYFGFIINVPINTTKTIVLKYDLPPLRQDAAAYHLLIQKQSGTKGTTGKITVKSRAGKNIIEQEISLKQAVEIKVPLK